VNRRLGLTIVRIASVAIVLFAIGYTIYWFVAENRFNPSQFFAFFTIQSNLFGVAVVAALVVRGDRPRSPTFEMCVGRPRSTSRSRSWS
jgi:hypothetical protein